jgi:formamidopyrimidine-DNA glycosylase
MPELPEVETVRGALAMLVAGQRVEAVSAKRVMMRRPLDPEELAVHLVGSSIRSIRRRAKFLLLDTDRDGALLVHLGMSGRLAVVPADVPAPLHTHLRLRLADGRELRLTDPRRFGLAVWLAAQDEASDPSLARLGVEPLDGDLSHRLPAMVVGRRAPIKALLMDQRLVVGVGNIYATEALHRAGIRPSRPGGAIRAERLERLARAVETVLTEAIVQGGTTLRDFTDPAGSQGYFAVCLDAYGRAGQPCHRCGTRLRSDVIAGRTTVWCGRCQR